MDKTDRDLLIRLDENVKIIKEKVDLISDNRVEIAVNKTNIKRLYFIIGVIFSSLLGLIIRGMII